MKEKEILEKVKQDYDKLAEHFNITRQYDWREFEIFKKYINEYALLHRAPIKILDIGCGNGRLIDFLNKLEIEYEYIGIDNSIEQTKSAIQNVGTKLMTSQNAGKIQFKIADILNLSEFQENEFDIIFCIATFHHLPSKQLRHQALKGIYRILKKDGLLFMTSWNLFQLKYIKYLFDINKYKNANNKSLKDLKKNKFNILDFFKSFKFSIKDTFIPWKNEKGQLMSHRYYYAFNKTELRNLFVKNDFQILENKLTDDKNILQARNIVSIVKK